MKPSIKRVLFYLICAGLFFLKTNCSAENVDLSRLKSAIRKIATKATFLTESDMDTSSCGKRRNPGIVKADFTGNGQKDYAVLLKMGAVEDTVYKDGNTTYPWKKLKVWLVVFLRQGDGSFKSVVLEKINDHSFPAYVYVRRINLGEIQGFDSEKKATIKNPGIGLDYCEKSEVVYYWDESLGKFRKIITSD